MSEFAKSNLLSSIWGSGASPTTANVKAKGVAKKRKALHEDDEDPQPQAPSNVAAKASHVLEHREFEVHYLNPDGEDRMARFTRPVLK